MAAKSFRFLHASDFHLDQPPGGLSQLPPELVDPLIEATYQAVDRVFDVALREQVAFVVLCGDIIHFPTASPRAVDFLGTQFHRCEEANIPIYWLGGQLESAGLVPDEFVPPSNVFCLPTQRVTTAEVKQQGKTIAYLVGQSAGEHTYANLQDMRVPRDGRFFVGLWYCQGCEELDGDLLDELGIDYWALGGRHQPRSLDTMIPAEICGTPQGRVPAESGPHGCLLVTVTGDDIDATQLVETDAVRYRSERIRVKEGDDCEQLAAKMKSRLETIRHDVDNGKPILVTWDIEGDTPLGRRLRRFDEAEAFLEQFRRDARDFESEKHMWSIGLQCVRDSVASDLLDEDSLLGDFLRVLRDQQVAGQPVLDLACYLPATESAQQLAARLHLEDLPARQQLLREVTALGIDLLSGESS